MTRLRTGRFSNCCSIIGRDNWCF